MSIIQRKSSIQLMNYLSINEDAEDDDTLGLTFGGGSSMDMGMEFGDLDNFSDDGDMDDDNTDQPFRHDENMCFVPVQIYQKILPTDDAGSNNVLSDRMKLTPRPASQKPQKHIKLPNKSSTLSTKFSTESSNTVYLHNTGLHTQLSNSFNSPISPSPFGLTTPNNTTNQTHTNGTNNTFTKLHKNLKLDEQKQYHAPEDSYGQLGQLDIDGSSDSDFSISDDGNEELPDHQISTALLMFASQEGSHSIVNIQHKSSNKSQRDKPQKARVRMQSMKVAQSTHKMTPLSSRQLVKSVSDRQVIPARTESPRNVRKNNRRVSNFYAKTYDVALLIAAPLTIKMTNVTKPNKNGNRISFIGTSNQHRRLTAPKLLDYIRCNLPDRTEIHATISGTLDRSTYDVRYAQFTATEAKIASIRTDGGCKILHFVGYCVNPVQDTKKFPELCESLKKMSPHLNVDRDYVLLESEVMDESSTACFGEGVWRTVDEMRKLFHLSKSDVVIAMSPNHHRMANIFRQLGFQYVVGVHCKGNDRQFTNSETCTFLEHFYATLLHQECIDRAFDLSKAAAFSRRTFSSNTMGNEDDSEELDSEYILLCDDADGHDANTGNLVVFNKIFTGDLHDLSEHGPFPKNNLQSVVRPFIGRSVEVLHLLNTLPIFKMAFVTGNEFIGRAAVVKSAMRYLLQMGFFKGGCFVIDCKSQSRKTCQFNEVVYNILTSHGVNLNTEMSNNKNRNSGKTNMQLELIKEDTDNSNYPLTKQLLLPRSSSRFSTASADSIKTPCSPVQTPNGSDLSLGSPQMSPRSLFYHLDKAADHEPVCFIILNVKYWRRPQEVNDWLKAFGQFIQSYDRHGDSRCICTFDAESTHQMMDIHQYSHVQIQGLSKKNLAMLFHQQCADIASFKYTVSEMENHDALQAIFDGRPGICKKVAAFVHATALEHDHDEEGKEGAANPLTLDHISKEYPLSLYNHKNHKKVSDKKRMNKVSNLAVNSSRKQNQFSRLSFSVPDGIGDIGQYWQTQTPDAHRPRNGSASTTELKHQNNNNNRNNPWQQQMNPEVLIPSPLKMNTRPQSPITPTHGGGSPTFIAYQQRKFNNNNNNVDRPQRPNKHGNNGGNNNNNMAMPSTQMHMPSTSYSMNYVNINRGSRKVKTPPAAIEVNNRNNTVHFPNPTPKQSKSPTKTANRQKAKNLNESTKELFTASSNSMRSKFIVPPVVNSGRSMKIVLTSDNSNNENVLHSMQSTHNVNVSREMSGVISHNNNHSRSVLKAHHKFNNKLAVSQELDDIQGHFANQASAMCLQPSDHHSAFNQSCEMGTVVDAFNINMRGSVQLKLDVNAQQLPFTPHLMSSMSPGTATTLGGSDYECPPDYRLSADKSELLSRKRRSKSFDEAFFVNNGLSSGGSGRSMHITANVSTSTLSVTHSHSHARDSPTLNHANTGYAKSIVMNGNMLHSRKVTKKDANDGSNNTEMGDWSELSKNQDNLVILNEMAMDNMNMGSQTVNIVGSVDGDCDSDDCDDDDGPLNIANLATHSDSTPPSRNNNSTQRPIHHYKHSTMELYQSGTNQEGGGFMMGNSANAGIGMHHHNAISHSKNKRMSHSANADLEQLLHIFDDSSHVREDSHATTGVRHDRYRMMHNSNISKISNGNDNNTNTNNRKHVGSLVRNSFALQDKKRKSHNNVLYEKKEEIIGIKDESARQIWKKSCFLDAEFRTSSLTELYPSLMQEFRVLTCSKNRLPTISQIKFFFLRTGGQFDPLDTKAIIHSNKFEKFYKWFDSLCNILKDLRTIYDTDGDPLIGMFYGRNTAEELLEMQPDGTFILRLASQPNGLAITYRNRRKVQNCLLTRVGTELYRVGKSDKETHLFKLIRPWAKLKWLYTPKKLIPKKIYF